jgi:CelD/BcsL family acetyltransferase involved in cellulose biosynthesis
VRAGSPLAQIADSYPGCSSPVPHLTFPDTEFGALSCLPDLSPQRRRNLRRARNGLHGLGDVRLDRLTNPEKLAVSLPGFVKERIASWRQRGRLSELPNMDRHPSFSDFLAEVGYALAKEGRCFLARLCVDGNPIAQNLFFRAHDTNLMYMTTYRVEFARFSPSHLLLAEIAQQSVKEGNRMIETGRGDEVYKFDLGAEARHLYELEFSR